MTSIRKCLILAAGRGSRMASGGLPKPLLPLLGLPLLERVILTAARAGLEDFIVVTGFEGDRVRRFLDGLAARRGIQISHVQNDEWEAGNGLSAYAARDEIKDEPFVLLMADHLVDERLLEELREEPLEAGTVRLAVDSNTRNPLVDLGDVTRVEVKGARVQVIGKGIERYNAFDTGCFLCTAGLFAALERARTQKNDTTLSGAIRLLAEEGKVHAFDIGDAFWIDVDDPAAMKRAETTLLGRLRKSTDGPVSRHLNRPLSARITRYLVRSPITPNQISFFCFALSALAAGLFAAGSYLALALGGLLAHLSSVVDGCDGEVARLRFRESAYGGWLDAVLDRYADGFLLFGLTLHVFSRAGSEAVLVVGFLAIIGSFTVSYTADKYDGLMKARFERGQSRGIRIGRDLRVLMISLGALLNLPFLALSLIAGIMNAETMRRMVIAQRGEAKRDGSQIKGLKRVRRRIAQIVARSSVPEDPRHSTNTLEWLLRLDPKADAALRIAALGHDIDRADAASKVHREDFSTFDAFKAAHARNSARILMEIMQECGVQDEPFMREVCRLVRIHEIGGDPRSDLLVDADSISYFDVNLPLYLERNTWEETRRRCVWGYLRLSERGKAIVAGLSHPDRELSRLMVECIELATTSP